MRVEKYGIALERMGEGDIEMVREWRNSPDISQFMVFRSHITPAMQRKWFAGIDPERDFHFIVRYAGEPCGLADIKAVDWPQRTFVTGIFLTPQHWDTDLGMRVAYAIHDLAFFNMKLETAFCQVLHANRRALRFNLSLGYRILDDDVQDSIVHHLRLTNKEYERATLRLRSFLAKSTAAIEI